MALTNAYVLPTNRIRDILSKMPKLSFLGSTTDSTAGADRTRLQPKADTVRMRSMRTMW